MLNLAGNRIVSVAEEAFGNVKALLLKPNATYRDKYGMGTSCST